MASGRERPPAPMVEKTARGLKPLAAYDEEEINKARIGQTFDLIPRSKRSERQSGFYWLILNRITAATDIYPTASHLHDQLMRQCGFVVRVLNPFTGEYEERRDSFAFDRMTKEEADIYVTRALDALSAWLGFDVTILGDKKRNQ